MPNRLVLVFVMFICCDLPAQTTRPAVSVKHMLIISIDGLRPDLLLRSNSPRMHNLFHSGSYTFWARTTPASTTLPSHVSMLTGVVPEVHSVTWNDDLPLAERVFPAVPTLFELARKSGYSTALVSGKSKFNVLDKPKTLDWIWLPSTPTCDDPEVSSHAQRILREHQPGMLFVHFAGVDNVGHAKGWGSPAQMEAVERVDEFVGELLDTLDELKLADSTIIILTSDHGGAGRTHGPEDARSRTIPWIISGPGIRKDYDLTRVQDLDIETYDTFTTSCALLKIPIDRRVRGKFIAQALENRDLLRPATEPASP